MKKILVLLGVVLFPAFAFALNAEVSNEENCAAKRAAYEAYAADQDNVYFITQNILINLADPMETLSDTEATPLAVCYATYNIKGKDLVTFVRFNKGRFLPKERNLLAAFADRVERLSIQSQLDELSENQSHVMEWVLINLALPMEKKTNEEAAESAKVYQMCSVKGLPLMEYVRVHASEYYYGDVGLKLDTFVDRVSKLAK